MESHDMGLTVDSNGGLKIRIFFCIVYAACSPKKK